MASNVIKQERRAKAREDHEQNLASVDNVITITKT
jgi:hypothetical protein